ncbi:nicotinate-nucleotide diphosphorylase (carboxylating) [Exiguobacterium sp. KRL4]|uniref:carboxylating nicotinate-nucleotide diphosphorylase n=1 Tax=Exiguobacterium sp. KRL4 TaxID=1914536 RepID=UPI0008F864A9|nr:carboxylating nicotinate-nucleotide diphosphorylase [Exiguobacterium sp. KRL4]OIN66401.1 nicotinate-nucleotide diphosphorylase (carboxylating) [Exiguobacterium sp. KRL4]
MNRWHLQQQLKDFLIEDIGHQDVTSEVCLTGNEQGVGRFIAKESGVFCGEHVLTELATLLAVEHDLLVKDGQTIERGQVLAHWSGQLKSILTGERVALNLIQRTSGIATLTHQAVRQAAGQIRISDTRKTTPGLRMLEKHAVRVGGGFNHRGRLDDAVMIKDNHITVAGSITAAVERAKQQIGHTTPIEVEVETGEEVKEAVAAGVDIIMLDNRSPDEIKTFRKWIPKQITVELSGGITLDTLPAYCDTGADYISLGALTHSAPALDISMKIIGGKKDEG